MEVGRRRADGGLRLGHVDLREQFYQKVGGGLRGVGIVEPVIQLGPVFPPYGDQPPFRGSCPYL